MSVVVNGGGAGQRDGEDAHHVGVFFLPLSLIDRVEVIWIFDVQFTRVDPDNRPCLIYHVRDMIFFPSMKDTGHIADASSGSPT